MRAQRFIAVLMVGCLGLAALVVAPPDIARAEGSEHAPITDDPRPIEDGSSEAADGDVAADDAGSLDVPGVDTSLEQGPEVTSDDAVGVGPRLDETLGTVEDFQLTPRIVGGTNVRMSYAPWQVALVFRNAPSDWAGQYCGGSVLSSRWIVTAAHCVVFDGNTIPVGLLGIRAGTATLSTSRNDALSVDTIVVHPGYSDGGYANDIALVRLSAPLRLKKGSIEAIQPATSKPSSGTQARITGWGMTCARSSTGDFYSPCRVVRGEIDLFPTVLQGTTLTTQRDDVCRDELWWYGLDSAFNGSQMLCAKAPGWMRDTCQGDSGGPLAVQVGRTWRLAGITSWGVGCAWLSSGVYTNVANYRTWIEETILLPGTVPQLTTPVRTADGYRFQITNHTPGFRYDVRVTSGSGRVSVGRASGGVAPVTVSRVQPGASVTVEITTSRAEHRTRTSSVTSTALLAGSVPVLSRPVSTSDGFTFTITNYSAANTYQPSLRSGTGTVTLGTPSGGVLPVTVSGVARGRAATVQITTLRDGYTSRTASIKGSALKR